MDIRTGLCPLKKVCAENRFAACNSSFFLRLTFSRASRIMSCVEEYLAITVAAFALGVLILLVDPDE